MVIAVALARTVRCSKTRACGERDAALRGRLSPGLSPQGQECSQASVKRAGNVVFPGRGPLVDDKTL